MPSRLPRPRASARTAARLEALLDGMAAAGLVTAAWGLVADAEGVKAAAPAGRLVGGRRGPGNPPDDLPIPDWIFDLASLTKLVIATLALALDGKGLLRLRSRIGTIWPRAPRGLAERRLEDLLRHRSGLAAWAPLYELCSGPRSSEIERVLFSESVQGARKGTYSDLGYLLWGRSAELALGVPLGDLVRTHVAKPLRMKDLAFSIGGSASDRRDRTTACRIDTRREVALARELGIETAVKPPPRRGRVQDGNCRFLRRPCGHAGLFGSARDLSLLAREWLDPGRLLSRKQVEGALSGAGRYALGWERRRARKGAGTPLGDGAFGLAGFTGGSVWIDPKRGTIYVLLAHRAPSLPDLDPWRRRLHGLR